MFFFFFLTVVSKALVPAGYGWADKTRDNVDGGTRSICRSGLIKT